MVVCYLGMDYMYSINIKEYRTIKKICTIVLDSREIVMLINEISQSANLV